MQSPLTGRVTLPKELVNQEFLLREPFCRRAAYLDLWFLANDRPRTARINGRDVPLKRGQLAHAQASLGSRWRWSDEKVRKFLTELQDEGLIIFQPSRTVTVIEVIDYTVYNPDSASETETEPGTESDTETVTDSGSETGQKGEVGRGNKEVGRGKGPAGGEFESPDESEVLKFCSAWPGDQSRGIPPVIPESWALAWLASHQQVRGDWRVAIALNWRSDILGRHPRAMACLEKNGGKNGAVLSANGGGRTPAQARFELSRELEHITTQLDQRHELDQPPDTALLERERELRKNLAEAVG